MKKVVLFICMIGTGIAMIVDVHCSDAMKVLHIILFFVAEILWYNSTSDKFKKRMENIIKSGD